MALEDHISSRYGSNIINEPRQKKLDPLKRIFTEYRNLDRYDEAVINIYHSQKLSGPDFSGIHSLAVECDDFQQVLNRFSSIIGQCHNYDHLTAQAAINGAFDTYIRTQKLLAESLAGTADFDRVLIHVKNMCTDVQIDWNDQPSTKLVPKISEEHVKQIMEKAVRSTPPEHFISRLSDLSAHGDVKQFTVYAHYCIQSFKSHDLIEVPDINSFRLNGLAEPKYDSFVYLQQIINKLHKKAYGQAIRHMIEKAIGYAVNDRKYAVDSDIIKIRELRDTVQNMLLEAVDNTSLWPHAHMPTEVIFEFTNKYLNPLFEELHICRKDLNHPVRSLYTPSRGNASSYAEIDGAKHIISNSTAVVSSRHYLEAFMKTGFPWILRSF